ncbi:PepSY domain-containing protein [Micrococcus luteus]|uniref:PepSY domain-containing protein n=2 Tax=Bacteria TaxID=2 RepID=UPI0008A1F4BD|nr:MULTISPECIES: PepSY domain-containing protein [Micrococcus]MBY0170330.1 PepSY domain-containing protein [Micrococcus luteus]MBY0179870.1 PepSY domain-containing protein [Micrococcus luteus]MCM3481519.1 PepSY domain-containing protein [Micrococcus luteus]MCT1939431.1 PepSY domain-containing protein [Micrococcus luteus]MCV7448494.1 PepSY domain-containing protein [Micrococcus luteus]
MTITTLTRKTALTGTGVLAALALAACGTTADNGDDGSVSPEVDASSAVASTPATDDASTTSASASSSASSTAAAASSGSGTGQADDPAYAVIDAVLEKHGDGIIVEVDANDDDTTWEVDVVVGEEVKELDVTADGDITETDRESDLEDVQKAKDAEVTAQQALDTAREGRDGVTLDKMDLDDDNGTLQWEVEFDREDGSDGPEVEIDARSGEVLTVDEH